MDRFGLVCHRHCLCLPVSGGGDEDPSGGNQGAGSWTEWAWSAVPSPMSMLPITWDEPPDEEGDAGARLAAHERVVHFSVYVQQADTVFKVRGWFSSPGQPYCVIHMERNRCMNVKVLAGMSYATCVRL